MIVDDEFIANVLFVAVVWGLRVDESKSMSNVWLSDKLDSSAIVMVM